MYKVELLTLGSIPASAGGTGAIRPVEGFNKGLSPRVRGNARDAVESIRARGSIPASAGERLRRLRPRTASGVYPRECGGTIRERQMILGQQGLSPRVRGNEEEGGEEDEREGSIPASAGERCYAIQNQNKRMVYPRECGGTLISFRLMRFLLGLSRIFHQKFFHGA